MHVAHDEDARGCAVALTRNHRIRALQPIRDKTNLVSGVFPQPLALVFSTSLN